ncbi:MAG TPA: chemotaxis protein CheB [Anaerolineales bacterium]|nr:chemotaxis protein CheB [Anaerolineales bacterium]
MTIIGIGASAGGLKALRSFFGALPETTGMAFVVVTHLHPEHESILANILQGDTKMQVSQVTGKVTVEPDHVYVIPPNRRILMADHQLDVQEFDEPRGMRTPVDHFFRSLAKAHHEIVGIILSGGGTDGAVGIKAIKEEGGLLMVQSPEEAEYDGMPRAAISTGVIDVVLPVDELADTLMRYARHPNVLPRDADHLTPQQQELMQRILAHVNARTGYDFRQYKRSTVLRRIQRRMQISGNETLEAYQSYMRQNGNEAAAMFNDILIGVTNFFRDAESWDALAKTVIPALFANKHEGDSVRVWTVGCSTGEEAYTLGMLLMEHAATLNEKIQLQVFASDLDDRALIQAREGIYPSAIEADVSAARLEQFFTTHNSHYRVKRELRDIVLFAKHSVLRDPPFSKLDLISCRNLLIYIEREVQESVLDTFHYALNPNGYLFLGRSESAESAKALFQAVDKPHRIYRAKPWAGEHPHVPTLPLRTFSAHSYDPVLLARENQRGIPSSMTAIQDHLKALESTGPPSIWVNQDYLIVSISESAGRYLQYPGGPITSDLLKLVRPELQLELRTALLQAFERGKSIVTPPLSVYVNGKTERVVISVRLDKRNTEPNREPTRKAMVIFMEDESATGALQESTGDKPVRQSDEIVQQLEREVHHLRDRLQATLEEFNSSNEEMRAANEELQSINEEYRSTTEELETSKEELQSVNEELQTVNNELRSNVEEISRAHSDLENLMDATQIATLFLDRDLKIKRYSPGMENLFSVRPTDRGRHISDFTHKLGYQDLVEDARTVLEKLTVVERESTGPDGGSMLIRLLPYRTVDKRIDGVVISFVDITEVKNAERTRQNYESFYTLFHGSPVPTMLTRRDDNVIMNVNVAFLDYLALGREAVIGHKPEEFNLNLGMEPNELSLADKSVEDGNLRNFETKWILPSGETRSILSSVQHLYIQDTDTVLYTVVDITERVKAEMEIRRLNVERKTIEHKERHRIAQMLHDDLQQRLYAIKIYVNTLDESLQSGNSQSTQADFAETRKWLEEAIALTRQLGADLSPLKLRDGDLVEAILSISSQMKSQYGLEVELSAAEFQTKFGDELQLTLFQAVRELLFNVVKHSGSLKATVTLEPVRDDRVRIIVSDRGKGFDPNRNLTEQNHSRGLRSIQQDLKLFGGHLEVDSSEGRGTRMTIHIPIGDSGSPS